MQAHPQSTPAARIHSKSRSAPIAAPPGVLPSALPGALTSAPAASRSQPSSRVRLRGKSDAPLPETPSSLADAAGLAHDAGNLLAGLGLYCDLLSAPGVLRPEHRHYATELSLISNRSTGLIRRLIAACTAALPGPALSGPAVSGPIAFATLSSPSQTSDPAPQVSASEVRRRRGASSSETASDVSSPRALTLLALAPVLQGIAAGAATVNVVCGDSLPAHNVPSETIERIAVNLVRNAAEAIRIQHSSAPVAALRRSEIRVALGVVSGRLQLTVEDNGPGMPPAIAAAFLQPSALPRGASHGLGHRIVHELAAGSSAQISIRVRPGNGTLFCLKWPIPATQPVEIQIFELPATLSMKTPQEGTIPC